METLIAVPQPLSIINFNLVNLPALLQKTRTRVNAEQKPQFDLQATSAMSDCIAALRNTTKDVGRQEQEVIGNLTELTRAAEILRANIYDMNHLLKSDEVHITSEKRERLEFQATLIVSHCIETLKNQVERFSPEKFDQLKQEWRELHMKVETVRRRLELLTPPAEQDLITTLWWMAERGETEDLDLLQRVKSGKYANSEEVARGIETAEQRISVRAYDPDNELQGFFKLSPAQLTRLIGVGRANGDVSVTQHARQVVEQMRAIRESLGDLFEPDEIDRWLRAPNAMFDGQTPIEAMAEGQAEHIAQLLSRSEQGIHY